MPNEHRADPTPPPHHGQGRGGSKKESSSLRVSPALHPPERPSPRRADIADHGLGRETRELLLGMVEARSVNVKNTTTTTTVIVLAFNLFYVDSVHRCFLSVLRRFCRAK